MTSLPTEDKIDAMERAGMRMSPSPARLGKTLVELLKGGGGERPRLVSGASF